MQLKKFLSNQAFWTINKELANHVGLNATVLLQHFVDLQSNFFEDGGFYQQQKRLIKDLPLTIDHLRNATKVLIDNGFLTVVKRGVPAKNHYTVNEFAVVQFLSRVEETDIKKYTRDTTSGIPETPLVASKIDDKHKELNNTKNKDNTNIDVPSEDDIKGKIFFKIVERYPKNRIGNRQSVLKHFKKLSIKECKLSLVNLNRYLEHAGGYVKSLSNYVTQECYSEEWLAAEETNKNKKTDINNTKTFKGNYDNID